MTFTQDLINCNGVETSIIDSQTCQVPITALRGLPYDLPWGASIKAYVTAQNNYGISDSSDIGNGAIILTNPDAPINFAEDFNSKSATQIGLTWDDGAANGGTTVNDYQITYDQGIDDYVVLASNVATQSYIATSLTTGTVYKFKV